MQSRGTAGRKKASSFIGLNFHMFGFLLNLPSYPLVHFSVVLSKSKPIIYLVNDNDACDQGIIKLHTQL